MRLILASQSPYRREQMENAGLSFIVEQPRVDEEKLKDPSLPPQLLCESLACAKAESLAPLYPDDIVLGGDQLLEFEGEILGKAGSFEAAVKQLEKLQGKVHRLYTAICLVYNERPYCFTEISLMSMKKLSSGEIASYVKQDETWDCAGSYKYEKNGSGLFESVDSNDFSAITGLPMKGLIALLKELGYNSGKE